MKVGHALACFLHKFPNFHHRGSIKGMKEKYYGDDAKLVKSGAYIYNVTGSELGDEIYERAD